MMREIGVAADEPVVSGSVDAGDGVPGGRRRLVVDAQIALGAAFGDGMAQVDANVLRLAAAQSPDFGGSKAGGCDRRLAGNCDAKRGRDLRLFARQPHVGKRGGVTAGGGPDATENFGGALHDPSLPLVCDHRISTQGHAMAAIDPLTAGAVFIATAATDAVYVMFTSAVIARKRVPAANWSAVWYMLSSYAVISYTKTVFYVVFAAIGSGAGAYVSLTFLPRPPGGPPVGAAPE